MNFPVICWIGACVGIAFGLAFLTAPQAAAALYGIGGWNDGTAVIARLFGAQLLYLSAVLLALKDDTDRDMQRRCAQWMSGASAVAMAVALHGVLSGATNAWGWTTAAIYAFFVGAWGWQLRDRSTGVRIAVH
jgi:hypothetical protein